jgi:hypothetical protein
VFRKIVGRLACIPLEFHAVSLPSSDKLGLDSMTSVE